MINTVVIEPGKLDRSPTGTGVSALLALLHVHGGMAVGDPLKMRSVIGSTLTECIESDATVRKQAAIVPLITGPAWRYGAFEFHVDESDPWPLGHRVGDTWPVASR